MPASKQKHLRAFVSIAAILMAGILCPPPADAKKCAASLRGSSLPLSAFMGSSIEDTDCKGNSDFNNLKQFMRGTLVIGIPGYHNEGHDDYFGQLEDTVIKLGGSFAKVATDSRSPVDLDAPKVCNQVSRLLSGAQKAVIIGHSKGGGTALYMFRFCADVLGSSAVKAVISVNGVIQGSEFADFSVEKIAAGREAARILESIKKAVDRAPLLKHFIGDTEAGVSLTTRASQKRLQLLRQSAPGMSGKMFCVASFAGESSYQSDGSPASQMKENASAFRGRQNDGLVAYSSQLDSSLCPLKLTIPGANHMALIERDSADPSVPNSARQAFAAYLLFSVMAHSR